MLLPDWLNATTAADAVEISCVLPEYIRALGKNQHISGRAFPVLARRDDNRVVRQVIDAGVHSEGDVLVVAGADESRTAVVGDITTSELLNLGFSALVTDGPVCDTQEMKKLLLKVWCSGATTLASHKELTGEIGITVSI